MRSQDHRLRFLFSALFLLPFLISPPLFGEEKAAVYPTKEFQKQVTEEFQRHNYKKVIRLYKDFIVQYPDRFVPLTVRIFYSQSLADTGELEEAIAVLKEALVEMPPEIDPFRLQYDLANLLFMQRRYREARDAYQKVILQASRHEEVLAKAKNRLALMKESEGRKKDLVSLQLLDMETALEAGEVPEGAQPFLQTVVAENPGTPQAEQAGRLLIRLKEVRTTKARTLLEEARRLFDEKKFAEVREILDQIDRYYADVSEAQSVEALQKAVNVKSPQTTKKDTSPAPE
jgi:tetratricopeptide (TPR) repeat protein